MRQAQVSLQSVRMAILECFNWAEYSICEQIFSGFNWGQDNAIDLYYCGISSLKVMSSHTTIFELETPVYSINEMKNPQYVTKEEASFSGMVLYIRK